MNLKKSCINDMSVRKDMLAFVEWLRSYCPYGIPDWVRSELIVDGYISDHRVSSLDIEFSKSIESTVLPAQVEILNVALTGPGWTNGLLYKLCDVLDRCRYPGVEVYLIASPNVYHDVLPDYGGNECMPLPAVSKKSYSFKFLTASIPGDYLGVLGAPIRLNISR